MSELHDEWMRELLRSADGPRDLTSGERERLRARLDAAAAGEREHDGSVTVTPIADGRRRRRNATTPWIATAAAGVAVVAGIAFVARDRAPEPALDRHDAITVPAPLPDAWCSERVDPLVNALDRWRGVQNWAWAGGVPDVGSLAALALSDPPAGVDTALSRRAAQLSAALASELEAIDPAGQQRTTAAAREAAVAPALSLIAQIAADPAAGCPSMSITDLGRPEPSG